MNPFTKSAQQESKLRALARKKNSARMEYLLTDNVSFEVTEAFRNFKASLTVSMPKNQDGDGTVIVMTSACPEDGKTTVSVNLSLMFAFSEAKVVLVDADARKGRVARFFRKKSAPGLADYLSGQASVEEIVRKSSQNENLSYITCGTHSPRPYELLESEEMKKLVQELRTRFDYVIIDTPPVLLISDALALSPSTDGTVLVCRHQVSYISDIERAINTLKFAKVNLLGIVVNDYKAPKTNSYGGYKKYYYYNSYGYGYGSTDPEDTDASDEVEETEEEPVAAPAASKEETQN